MNRRLLSTLAVVLACLGSACQGTGPPTTGQVSTTGTAAPITTSTVPTTTTRATSTTTSLAVTSPPTTGDGTLSEEARQECDGFTTRLDRFVFNRLEPILTEATGLLHSPPEASDNLEVAGGLIEAAEQLGGLVDELDQMGIPPREVVDLLLSIRQAVQLFATGFEKGARGWESADTDLIREAKTEAREAAAILTSFFGWQLCG